MPRYLFQLLDGTGADATELERECDTFEDARANAKIMLSDMVRSGLPEDSGNMMSVEIFDADKLPLVELRMTFDEIAKRT
jgi:hypothetical protein